MILSCSCVECLCPEQDEDVVPKSDDGQRSLEQLLKIKSLKELKEKLSNWCSISKINFKKYDGKFLKGL